MVKGRESFSSAAKAAHFEAAIGRAEALPYPKTTRNYAAYSRDTTLVDLLRANCLKRMTDQSRGEAAEAVGVGELCVRVEGGLIDPFGVDMESERTAERLVEMNANAARFGARRFEDTNQLVKELLFLAG